MITNADMTVFNYWYNPVTRQKEYRSTKIWGVHWHTEQKTVVEKGGIISADQFKIRIPKDSRVEMNRQFIDPKQYALLSPGEVDLFWTADKDDLIVREIIAEMPASLKDLKSRYSEAGKIQSCTVNWFGCNPHIRIGGAA